MDHEIAHRPSFATAEISLEAGEEVLAESGAMVSYGDGIEMETNATGGFLKSLQRGLFGGESFFQNTFTASEAGSVTFAPPLPGDVVHHELDADTVYVQSGSYIASDTALEVDTEFGGAKTFFGSEGLFLLRIEGSGPLFMSSYGAIEEVDLDPDETYTIDTGHIVAFEDTADFAVRRVGGLKSTLLSGEGLVAEFSGEGHVWLQTRSQDSFLAWLIPQLPTGNSSGST
ncbi:TIGR00266 family protein [Halorarum halobium]|uniref:TIGR00266 family protein n=1 Tax=Halorarum halobium TaxID=3075121 RepID=UPI0028AAA69A|nr:TIGR00266 family protein [Halobaculum sp. XH14]